MRERSFRIRPTSPSEQASRNFASPAAGPFDIFDGVRTLSICWVMLAHVTVFGQPIFGNAGEVNPHDGQGYFATWAAQIIIGGSFSVDTFFMMGGFLAGFLLLDFVQKLGKPRAPEGAEAASGDRPSLLKRIMGFAWLPLLYFRR
jgi:hypothetical protein